MISSLNHRPLPLTFHHEWGTDDADSKETKKRSWFEEMDGSKITWAPRYNRSRRCGKSVCKASYLTRWDEIFGSSVSKDNCWSIAICLCRNLSLPSLHKQWNDMSTSSGWITKGLAVLVLFRLWWFGIKGICVCIIVENVHHIVRQKRSIYFVFIRNKKKSNLLRIIYSFSRVWFWQILNSYVSGHERPLSKTEQTPLSISFQGSCTWNHFLCWQKTETEEKMKDWYVPCFNSLARLTSIRPCGSDIFIIVSGLIAFVFDKQSFVFFDILLLIVLIIDHQWNQWQHLGMKIDMNSSYLSTNTANISAVKWLMVFCFWKTN